MNEDTTDEPTTDTSFDEMFVRKYGELIPCPQCGDGAHEKSLTDGLCAECYEKTPAAIEAARLKEAQRLEEANANAKESMDYKVSPEIRVTDIDHPDFNRDAWNRFQQKFDGKLWPWFHSKASGQSKTRMAYLVGLNLYLEKPSRAETYPYPPFVKWVDGDQLADACRTRHIYSYGDEVMTKARETVEECRKVKVLIIDDLMKRNWTSKAASDGLWEIVKHRHEYQLLTVITDNVTPADIEDRIHPDHASYIIRRLAERTLCVKCD